MNRAPWTHVLITGGAGFIGSNLALAIQKRHPECRITVIDDFRSGSFANLGFPPPAPSTEVEKRTPWMVV